MGTLHPAFSPTSPFRNYSRQLVQPRAGEWEVGPAESWCHDQPTGLSLSQGWGMGVVGTPDQ